MTKNNNKIFNLVAVSLFIAIAYISSLVLPVKVQFLTLDIKDAFITIGALYFGPLSAVIISAAVSLLEIMFGSDTGLYGFIMNFIGSAVFAGVASLIYRRGKSLLNAVFGLVSACISMTAVMIFANILITPFYMHVTRDTVIGLIVPLFLPFNLVKGFLNASLTMLLYKPISNAMKRTRLNHEVTSAPKANIYTTILTSAIAIICIVASVLYIVLVLKGDLK